MERKIWTTYMDPEVIQVFKTKASAEGRSMASILRAFMLAYAQGRVNWEMISEKDANP